MAIQVLTRLGQLKTPLIQIKSLSIHPSVTHFLTDEREKNDQTKSFIYYEYISIQLKPNAGHAHTMMVQPTKVGMGNPSSIIHHIHHIHSFSWVHHYRLWNRLPEEATWA
jgi:hypothetical protein